MLTNLEEGNDSESIKRVMCFTIHIGLKRTPFEIHHCRKPTTELTKIVEDGKHNYRIDQEYLFQHQPNKSKVPIFVDSDVDGE